jgi:UDP-2,3-diacylglucosamine pyrophosphatase LpxH
MGERASFRAVFMSDVHLGASSSRADDAAEFLKHLRCETLYLVGDIIDMWRLRSRWHWPESHNRLVKRVLKMSKNGTRVVLIPGNHDEHARQYAGLNFGGVEVSKPRVHPLLDGRRLLVTHGDEADLVIRHAPLLSMIGGRAYDLLVVLNRWYNRVLVSVGRRPWSLSQAVKLKVKKACRHIARFEETLALEARRRGLDGVVCGHIHKAEMRTMPCGTLYLNCGDWIESCTAIVEDLDGTLRVVDGLEFTRQQARILGTAAEHDPEPDPEPEQDPDDDRGVASHATVNDGVLV